MQLRALHNTIIFQFEDAVNNKGEFESQHSKFWMKASFDESAKKPRWGVVIAAGQDCDDIQPGDRIMIPALRWTNGVSFEDQKYWKTDDTQIVLRDRAGDVSIRNKFVVFKPQAPKADVCSGIVLLYQVQPNSPVGIVHSAAEAFPDAAGDVITHIRYNDALFNDTFDLSGQQLSFIKQDDILCYEHITI